MKKKLCTLLLLLCCVLISGCGRKTGVENPVVSSEPDTSTDTAQADEKAEWEVKIFRQ